MPQRSHRLENVRDKRASRWLEVLEELPYGVVARVGDRERLQTKLPLRLQCRELARFLFHIGIDETSDT